MPVTSVKIDRLSRALIPRGIKDIDSLVATAVKYRNRDGHVKIWRAPSDGGGWSWFASPAASSTVTPAFIILGFPSDYRRNAAAAREEIYRKLEDAALSVMPEDEINALVAIHAPAKKVRTTRVAQTKESVADIDREIAEIRARMSTER